MTIKEFVNKNKIGDFKENVSLKKYNTYKVGSKCLGIAFPNDRNSLIKLLKFLKENKYKYKIIGMGSNLIFSNDYYNGVFIRLDKLNNLKIDNNVIFVEAGYPLNKLSLKVSEKGLTGLEFAAGIPGTVGGAVYMNAGAYKSDMGYIVKEVEILTPDFKIIRKKNKDLNFHYRTSFFKENPEYICLSAVIKLSFWNVDEIMTLIKDRKERREASQPLNYPSAGSIFRNPEGMFAGELIEKSGLKGKVIGGAQVSTKHANFIINKGNATGKEIKDLIYLIKNKIKENYKVDLQEEQEYVDWE